MSPDSGRTGAAVEAHYQFLAWLARAAGKSPFVFFLQLTS